MLRTDIDMGSFIVSPGHGRLHNWGPEGFENCRPGLLEGLEPLSTEGWSPSPQSSSFLIRRVRRGCSKLISLRLQMQLPFRGAWTACCRQRFSAAWCQQLSQQMTQVHSGCSVPSGLQMKMRLVLFRRITITMKLPSFIIWYACCHSMMSLLSFLSVCFFSLRRNHYHHHTYLLPQFIVPSSSSCSSSWRSSSS